MRRVSIALKVDQHAGNTRKANKREIDPEGGSIRRSDDRRDIRIIARRAALSVDAHFRDEASSLKLA